MASIFEGGARPQKVDLLDVTCLTQTHFVAKKVDILATPPGYEHD